MKKIIKIILITILTLITIILVSTLAINQNIYLKPDPSRPNVRDWTDNLVRRKSNIYPRLNVISAI